MKLYNFQKVLPRARKVKGDPFVTQGKLPPKFKVKNMMAFQAHDRLKAAGWQVEGRHDGEHATSYGMFKDDEHITVSDSGKYPYNLGDTVIDVRPMTYFYQAPINLR